MSNEYYLGKGTGDLNIKAECMFVSQICNLKDAWYYKLNPVASSNLNIALPNNAIITYKMKHIGSNGGVSLLLQDSSHNYYIGNWSSSGTNGVLIRNIGSSTNLLSKTLPDLSLNKEHLITLRYNNGEWEYSADNGKSTFSTNYLPTKLMTIDIGSTNSMTELLIMPL